MGKIESAMIVPQRAWDRLPFEVSRVLAEICRKSSGYTVIYKASGVDCDLDGRLHDLLAGLIFQAWPEAVKRAEGAL